MTNPVPAAPSVHALVVEDDPTVQAMLRAWLHLEGATCTVETDLAGARAALRDGAFDILLCDLHLPDGEGTDLVEELGQHHPGLPVVFLTGEPTLESAVRSVSLRVAAYLIKPPDTDELRRILRREVALYRSRRAIRTSRERLAAWDRDLAAIEAAGPSTPPVPLVDFIQVTIRHLTDNLLALEQSLTVLKTDQAGQRGLEHLELQQSLRNAIGVLEQTRQHFKSRELGHLRRDLQAVLARIGGGDSPSSPA